MTIRLLLGGLTAATLLLAQTASAEGARVDEDEVTTLLVRGFELRRQHRNEEALAAYDQAFALSPTPAVRAQRALAEQTLGHWVVAESDLDLALGSDDSWVARNRAALEDARAVVRQHLAWLTVDVDVSNADILLDGERLPQGAVARVVAGVGILQVRAPGRIPDIRRVSFAPSEHVHQQISLAPLVTPAPPAPVALLPASTTSPRPELEATRPPVTPIVVPAPTNHKVVPVVPIAVGTLAVAGIAGVITGAYYGVRSGQERNAERAACPAGACTQESLNEGLGDYWDANRSAIASDVAIASGITLLVGGAALWLFERRTPRRATSGLNVMPAVGMGMNGLVVRGSF